MEYDVVVVGAGPAGTSTAKACAEKGLNVVVFDRNQEIGTPVRCGEGLSDNSVKRLGLDIPSRCIAQKTDGAIVYAPNGKEIFIKYENTKGYILERKVFDKWLAFEASKAGAKIFAKSNVVDLLKENGKPCGAKVETMDGLIDVKAKVIVAADGVESMIARKAGMKANKAPLLVDSGFEYEMSNIKLRDPKMIELFFGSSIAPRGYVWIFPKGDAVANVGIGISGAGAEKTAKEYLDGFIKENEALKNGSIIEVKGGSVPVGGLMKNMVSDALLLVGDAANQVNPIHGGGIAESITAGGIAGGVIAGAINRNDVSATSLSQYNKLWWEQRGNSLEKVEKVRKVFEKMTDQQMNNMAEALSGEDLYDFAHGKGLLKLGKVLIKYGMKNLGDLIGL